MWIGAENQIELILIRHGETLSNSQARYIGVIDESLSDKGAEEILNKRYPKVDLVFISPMKRCLETAKIIYPDNKFLKIKDFREIDFGEFEGKSYKELRNNVHYQEWIDSDGKLPFPKGESRAGFVARCKKGFKEMLEKVSLCQSKKEIKSIALIVHGGTIMALLSSFGENDYFKYQCKNGEGFSCLLNIDNRISISEIRGLKK